MQTGNVDETSVSRREVASYPDYPSAQGAVAYLAEQN